MNILSAIPIKWKVVAVVSGLLFLISSIGASYVYIFEQGKKYGTLVERTAQDKEQIRALEEAIKERDLAYQKLQLLEEEIYNAPETDDGPLAPVLSRTLDQRVR